MSAYEKVDVVSDTPEWEAERRLSVGASEVAAVMGLSRYNTALDVFKHKLGVDKHFDPVLSYIGHASENIIEGWLREFSGIDVDPQPGFMARSIEHPYLHASFDRFHHGPNPLPIQFKTASAFVGHEWNEGIPTDIRVQLQAELAVSGAPRALCVVWIGGREFKTYWEPRDQAFIDGHLIPAVQQFWDGNVRAQVPPDPSTTAELNDIPVEPGKAVEADDTVLEAIERRAVLLSDSQSMTEEADQLKVAIGTWMGDADTITKNGRNILTFRYQKGRAGLDTVALRRDHPDLVAEYTTTSSPFRVMRTVKQKETSNG